MKSIKEIYETLNYLDRHMFSSTSQLVIRLLRKRLMRLTKDEEEMIVSQFSIPMFVDTLPCIVHSLNFFYDNTTNFPIRFQQDLVLKYLCSYEQIVTSSEDIFISRKPYDALEYEFEHSQKESLT